MSARRTKGTNAGWAMFRLRGIKAQLEDLIRDQHITDDAKKELEIAYDCIRMAIGLQQRAR